MKKKFSIIVLKQLKIYNDSKTNNMDSRYLPIFNYLLSSNKYRNVHRYIKKYYSKMNILYYTFNSVMLRLYYYGIMVHYNK